MKEDLDAMLQLLADETGLPLDEVRARFLHSFAPDPELEAALERIEAKTVDVEN